jgi:NAD+ kinase
MSTATFLVHPERPDALALALDTAEWLTAQGDVARILQFSAPNRVTEAGLERHLDEVDLTGSTVAVAMGGDGTFLRVVRLAWTEDVPVLGVNFGRLGYLPDLVPDQVREALTRVFKGEAVIEARCALEVSITDRFQGDAVTSYLALNEVVLEKIDFGHTVIIATPTGSTAYNLSARGPILAPALRAMVVTPVAPHLSVDRSLVLTDTQKVMVRIAPDRTAALVIDGMDVRRLEPESTVTCCVAARPVRVVRNDPHGFGAMLRFRLLADREQ